MTDIIQGISNAISGAVDSIQSFIETENNGTHEFINTFMSNLFGSIRTSTDSVKNKIDDTEDAISGNISSATSEVQSKLDIKTAQLIAKTTADTQTVKDKINSQSDAIRSTISNTSTNIISRIGSVVNSVTDVIGDTSRTLGDIIGDVYRLATDRQVKAIKDQTDALNNLRVTTKNKLEENASVVGGELNDLNAKVGDISEWLFGLPINLNPEDIRDGVLNFLAPFIKLRGLYEDIQNGHIDTGDELNAKLEDILGDSVGIKIIFGLVIGVPLVLNVMSSFSAPFAQNIQNLAVEQAKPNIPTLAEAYDMFRRRVITDDTLETLMDKNGIKQEYHSALKDTIAPLLPPEYIQQLFLRGLMTQEQHDDYFTRYGYNAQDARIARTLYNFLPPVQDLIRMAVREVFSPAIAQRYGLFEDFPEQFKVEGAKVGLSEDVARKYWAAHWDLPSPTQGYEMVHRGIITEAQLEELLRALDYMPFWRDKLIALNYNPLTRVDVRRMYGLGVLNRAEVKRAYKDIGYNDANAERLTEFTVRYEDENGNSTRDATKHATRTTYERAYDYGIMSRSETKEALIELGYDRNDAELFLDLIDFNNELDKKNAKPSDYIRKSIQLTLQAYERQSINRRDTIEALRDFGYTREQINIELDFIDYNKAVKIKDTLTAKVKAQYIDGFITRQDVHTILSTNGFVATEISIILRELDVIKDFKDQRPTKAELFKFFKDGLLNNRELYRELSDIGYSDKYIALYFAQANIEWIE